MLRRRGDKQDERAAEAPDAGHSVACPGCGKTYRWKTSFLGNELHCKCGKVFRAPPPAGAVPPVLGDAGVDAMRRGPTSLASVGKSPVLAALENREDEVQPNRWLEWRAPMIVLVVGYFAHIVALSNLVDPKDAIAIVVAQTVAGVVLFGPVVFGAVVAVARIWSKPVGYLLPTLLKVAAIALGLCPLADVLLSIMMVEGGWRMLLVGFAVYVPAVVLPAALFFGLDVHEASAVGLVVYLAKLGPLFLAPELFPNAF